MTATSGPDEICPTCRAAVIRTYQELLDLGEDEPLAFRSAMRVLSLRHPGRDSRQYTGLVTAWLESAGEAVPG